MLLPLGVVLWLCLPLECRFWHVAEVFGCAVSLMSFHRLDLDTWTGGQAKKGGLARDEEDIEYIGLSSSATAASPHQPSTPQRLLMKQSKVVVEEDEGTGSTPKRPAMGRIRGTTTTRAE